ncbi:MAG: hypothetical protein K6U74_07745, partial [Firmicutes bacterium]|nr:hypothetical protein [Bacillota bacterium]
MRVKKMVNFDEDDLVLETEKYWDDVSKCKDLTDYLANLIPYYVNELMIKELEWAGKPGKHKNLPDARCRHLALLVGHSLEPLLQSIKVYSPRYVFLLLSKDYGSITGKEMG